MKHRSSFIIYHSSLVLALTAIVLMFAACNKENERDITYIVAENTTTVHLKTDAEWDALLDRFCDYVESDSSVTFYNTTRANKGSAAKEATSYSTTNREAMKRWMKQMEEEGKTVTVTYDPNTGTYNGTAYATAPQTQPSNIFKGVITEVLSPQMGPGSTPPEYLWALQDEAGRTLIIATDGEWYVNRPLSGVYSHSGRLFFNYYEEYSIGDTVTFRGTLQTRHDRFNNEFLQLNLAEDPIFLGNGVSIYVSEGYDFLGINYNIIVTIDSANRKAYINYNPCYLDSIESNDIMIPNGISHRIYNKNSRLILQKENPEYFYKGNTEYFYIERRSDGSLFLQFLRDDMNDIMPTSCVLVPAPQGIQTWYSEQMSGIIMNILPDSIESQPTIYRAQICVQWSNNNGYCFNPFYHNWPSPYFEDGGTCEIHRIPTNIPGLDWEASFNYCHHNNIDFHTVDSLGLSGHNIDNNDFSTLVLHDLHQNPCYNEYVFIRIK